MADTVRQLAALQALLPDNTTGDISAQDVRDFLVSAIPTGRSASAVIAASGATDKQKADADYVCDGTADQVEINAALTAVGAQGRIVLTDGQFNLAARITMGQSGQVLEGQGRWATKLYLSNGANDNMIVVAGAAAVQGQMIRGMNLDGNGANQTDGGSVEARSAIYLFGQSHTITDPVLQDLYVTARGMGISCDGATATHITRPRFIDVTTIQNGVPGISGGGAFDGDGIHMGYCDDVVLLGINSQFNSDTGIACDFGSNLQYVATLCRANKSNQYAIARGTTGAYLFGPVADGYTGTGNYGIRTGQFGDGASGNTDKVHVYGGRILGCAIAGLQLDNNSVFRIEATAFTGNTANVVLGTSPGFLLARACPGITTEKGGTSTIANGATNVVVAHGMSFAPTAQQITVIPTGALPTSGGPISVFAVDATNITFLRAGTTGNLNFSWAIREDL
jgi:hypothetical protein